MGLPRAFLHAGASQVLVSLWQVDDKATSVLMDQFYKLWNPEDGSEPLPAEVALRRAQDAVRTTEGWEHPTFWAGWVLWGRDR